MTMTGQAIIYDAVRTPRGKGKNTGSLHEITSLQLATQALRAIKDRNNLDTSKVDDVVLGCVSPVGEQGSGDRFYADKLITARYFFERVLPDATSHLAKVKTGAGPVMALGADSF